MTPAGEATAGLAAAPKGRLSLRGQLTLSVLWLGLNFQSSALLPIVVPAQVLLLVDRGSVASSRQALAVSALSIVAAVVAVVATPLAGAVSERVRARTGRRRALIVAGILSRMSVEEQLRRYPSKSARSTVAR